MDPDPDTHLDPDVALLTDVSVGVLQSDTGGDETGAEEEYVELFTTPTTKLAAGTSDFGYNLFRALGSRETSRNIFLAPISVSAALTQLSMGENTNTLQVKAKLVLQVVGRVCCLYQRCSV